MFRKTLVLGTLTAAMLSSTAMAGAGDWVLRFGAHQVDPKSNNNPTVNVDSAKSLTLNVTYFVTDNWAVEVLGAVPFKHDIRLNSNNAVVASTRHLPPTVGLQYHFMPNAPVFRPYVALGLNYTLFYDVKTQGALAGARLDLSNSFGPSAEIGADFALNDKWAINVEARWFDIDTKAKLNGASLGTVAIDPYAIGVMVAYKIGHK